jgi:type II secretory pathway component PulC
MKINYIYIKYFFIAVLSLYAVYQLIILIIMLSARPNVPELTFQEIDETIVTTSISTDLPKPISEATDFDFKVVGYRAGQTRSSVIVQKKNKSFVVQQGELLENKYKLIKVDDEFAIFEYSGQSYQLETNLLNEN